MDNKLLKELLWSQFGASIDTLENVIRLCPDENWDLENKFWYDVYHTLFFLDYYLTLDTKNFSQPEKFYDHFERENKPESAYTKNEMLWYLEHCREKCRNLIAGLDENWKDIFWINQSKTMHYNIVEILLYNMRHVQHHAAQLNFMLRQQINDATDWVSRTDKRLNA